VIELSESNVVEYLRQAGRISPQGEVLVQSLADAASENIVLKVFDVAGGGKIGSDLRSAAQIQKGTSDKRMPQGACMILKQPPVVVGDERALGGDETQAETGLARLQMEKLALEALAQILPAGSVPDVLWFDADNIILATSCAPTDAIWLKKHLAAGAVSMDGAVHAAMLLAMLHSSTKKDAASKQQFSDNRFFVQRHLDPLIRATSQRHPAMGRNLQDAAFRARSPLCLIHGNLSPEHMFLVPAPPGSTPPAPAAVRGRPTSQKPGAGPVIEHVMLVDFDNVFFGHNAYDVAKFIADLLLVGFLRGAKWRAFMMMSDSFWQTYRHTADPELVKAAEVAGGRILGTLLLAAVDGPAPMKDFLDKPDLQSRVRALAIEILKRQNMSLDEAMDEASMRFDEPT
jgi:hypothetical protein